jgi:hypothetical protein
MLLQVVLKSNRWDQRNAPLLSMPLQAGVRTCGSARPTQGVSNARVGGTLQIGWRDLLAIQVWGPFIIL